MTITTAYTRNRTVPQENQIWRDFWRRFCPVRIDRSLVDLHGRIDDAVKAMSTSLTDVFGVGAIVACYLIGHNGDVRRFPTVGQYARYNATAPIEASSGPTNRHGLTPNGNRQLNHAIHIAALGQISPDTPGRAYYLAKQAPREVPQRKRCAA